MSEPQSIDLRNQEYEVVYTDEYVAIASEQATIKLDINTAEELVLKLTRAIMEGK